MIGALKKISLLLALTVSASAQAGSDLTVSGSDFRVIHGTLLKPDGSPAAGRKVWLAALDRPYVYADLDNKLSAKHWNFTTDKRGQFTVKIWRLDIQSALAAGLPGDGNYQLVAAPADGEAGAVSPCITTDANVSDRDWGNEWGKALSLADDDLTLTMNIQTGIEVRGVVLDYEHPDRPLAGVVIGCENRLPMDTHTGWAGGIFHQGQVTDKHGRFAFRHVYPVDIHLGGSMPHQTPLSHSDMKINWLKTKVDGQWIDDCVDVIEPKTGQVLIELQILAATKNLFRYTGAVTDADNNRPIAGVKITFGNSYHRTEQTWTDSHNYESVETGADGEYEIFLQTPWVRGISTEKDGYARTVTYDETTFAPGVYNFKLTATTSR